MNEQKRRGTVSSLLSVNTTSSLVMGDKDPLKLVNFKMKESEIKALDLYCTSNGISNKSAFIRALICREIGIR